MNTSKAPFIRILIALAIIGIFFSVFLREFFKVTFMFGIPFIFLLGFMAKRKRYSFSWLISLVLLIVILGGYGYMLTKLPERVEVKNIIRTAITLEGQGQYDEAIEEYSKLGEFGKTKKMNEGIANAKAEQKGAEIIKEAQEYIDKGDMMSAQELLRTVPDQTRKSKEAKKILKTLEDS